MQFCTSNDSFVAKHAKLPNELHATITVGLYLRLTCRQHPAGTAHSLIQIKRGVLMLYSVVDPPEITLN